MFVVFVLALSKDRILIMYFTLFQPCITDAHRCIDVYAAAVHLYDWETPDFSPLLPLILPLFLFVQDQSIANYFLVSLFCRFVMMTKHKNLSPRFLSRAKILPGNMQTSALLPSPLMTPRPGRNESPQRRMAKHF